MDEQMVRRYVSMVEDTVAEANSAAQRAAHTVFFDTLLRRTEEVVEELERDLRREGLEYPTPNETKASARAILWAAWTSWMWASKAERGTAPDESAKRARRVFERLLSEAIEFGRRIGRHGARP